MVDYGDIIQVGVCILLLIFSGFFLVKVGLIRKDQTPYINKYVFQVCYIPMLMRALATKAIGEMSFWPFLIGTLMNLTMQVIDLFFFALPVPDPFANYLGVTLSCCFVNYLVIGMPIFQTVWPNDDISTLPIFSLSNDLVTTPTYQIYSGIYNIIQRNKIHVAKNEPKERFTLKMLGAILLRVLKSPIIIGNILGFIWSAIGWELPLFLDKLLQFGNNVVTAVSLMMCGAFIAQNSILACPWWEFVIAMIIRHFVMPAIVILYCWALNIDSSVARKCVILSCLCTASTAFLMSAETKIEPGIASTMVLWTVIAMIPAVIIWFSILDAAGLFLE